ncbi:MAG: hypothetical protein HUU57_08005 [Bdellovibrio sp.]|nr:hypothetical protein [Bdellovibrio sp.]
MRIKTIRVALGVVVLSAVALSFQNCSPVAFQNSDVASSINDLEVPIINPEDPRCSFNGQDYAEGQTVTAFQSSSVPFGHVCNSEVRVCRNGSFTGSYPFSDCTAGGAESCLFNGQTIAHGGRVTAYASSSVAFGSNCVAQDRVCNNGALSGSYAFGTCSVGAAKSCLFNGQTVAHGQSVVAYQQSSVPFGQSCVSQARVCNNGVLSGSYANNACSVAPQKPQGPTCSVAINPSVLRPFVRVGNRCVTSNYAITFNCNADITKQPNGIRIQTFKYYKDGSSNYRGSSYYSQAYYSATGLYPGSNPMVLPASAFTMNSARSVTISAEFLLRNYGSDEAYHPTYGCNYVQRYDLNVNFYVGDPTAGDPKLFIEGTWPSLSLPAN